jgi:hypothetical protein
MDAAKGADVFTRVRLLWAALLAAAATTILVGAPAMVQAGISLNAIDWGGADMFTRVRLFGVGLLAAATTAVLVGAPAVVQAGLSFNGLD